MGKLHKDVAMFMVKCVEDESSSEQKIIKVRIFVSVLYDYFMQRFAPKIGLRSFVLGNNFWVKKSIPTKTHDIAVFH